MTTISDKSLDDHALVPLSRAAYAGAAAITAGGFDNGEKNDTSKSEVETGQKAAQDGHRQRGKTGESPSQEESEPRKTAS